MAIGGCGMSGMRKGGADGANQTPAVQETRLINNVDASPPFLCARQVDLLRWPVQLW